MMSTHYIIITEKESVAAAIAEAYDININYDGNFEKGNDIEKVSIFYLNGNIVEEIEENEKWRLDSLPVNINLNKRKVKDQFKSDIQLISLALKKSIEQKKKIYIVNACDAAREGEKIFRWAYNEIKKTAFQKSGEYTNIELKRLWISSLTKESILDSMPVNIGSISFGGFGLNLEKLDSCTARKYNNMYISAITRHKIDKYMGYNYTRLLTLTQEYSKNKDTIIYGRCKSPLLNKIAERELEIKNFKAESYLTVEVIAENGLKLSLYDEDDNLISLDFAELKKIADYIKENKYLSLKGRLKKNVNVKPPRFFNTVELQKVLSKEKKFKPTKTLSILESLYLKKMITYPRTSSEHLTYDYIQKMRDLFKSLSFAHFKEYIDSADFNMVDLSYFKNELSEDHHAIITTFLSKEKMQKKYEFLSEDEKIVFNKIAKRMIATLYDNHIKEYESFTYVINDEDDFKLVATNSNVKQIGFLKLYKRLKIDENIIDEKSKVKIKEVNIVKKTKAKPRKYKAEDLLTLMQTFNIGTAATQAGLLSELEQNLVTVDKNGYYSTSILGRKTLKYIPEKLKKIEISSILEDKLKEIETSSDAKKIRDEIILDMEKEFKGFLAKKQNNIK